MVQRVKVQWDTMTTRTTTTMATVDDDDDNNGDGAADDKVDNDGNKEDYGNGQ